jgi:hypothetical protein
MKQVFQSHLTAHGPGGAWVFLHIPFDAHAIFGRRGQIPVCGTLNGAPFRNLLLPEGNATHRMAVNRALQDAARARPGDLVNVTLELDLAERPVEIPPELQAALDQDTTLAKTFATLAPSHKREFAEWIASAKKPETRAQRATKAVPMILARERTR